MSFDLSEYSTVAERIGRFFERYPEGSLQSELIKVDDGWLCKAYAYRTHDDERPGVGHAFEQVPGKTPYTKDSEVMNAETHAYGRALVALGFETKKIASQEEVKARADGPTEAGEGKPVDRQVAGNSPADIIVPFGKHKGKTVREVPTSYWEWWLAQDGRKDEELRAAVELHLGLIGSGPVQDDLEDIPF